MPLNIDIDSDIVVLSNFGRLMNDPRYVDASQVTNELVEKGFAKFILDLGGFRETGSGFLGLLMTMTRRIRQHGAEAVLAHLPSDTEKFLRDMQLDDYWDIFKTVEEAKRSFPRESD
jgi:anti-anti-sigma regulatory factor